MDNDPNQENPDLESLADDEFLKELDTLITDLDAPAAREDTALERPERGDKAIPVLRDVVFKGGDVPEEAVPMLAALDSVANTPHPLTAADIERLVEEAIDHHLLPLREELKEKILAQINERVLRFLASSGGEED